MDINTIRPVNGSGGSIEPVEPLAAPAKSVAGDTGPKKQKSDETEASLSVQDIKELAEGMNEVMNDLQTSIGFSIREELNHQVVVEIKDRETDELIKQIPSEELLVIKEKMEEFTGLLFDQSV